MNFANIFTKLVCGFSATRARTDDPETSKVAARASVSTKAQVQRVAIRDCIASNPGGLTAREVALHTGIDYYDVQRRLCEVSGIKKTLKRRDGCVVWEAV